MVRISFRNRSAPTIALSLGAQDLHGDPAVVFQVEREIDGRHRTGAEFALEAVPIDRRSPGRSMTEN
ncbi:MAG TPA: hypothetical protein VF981_07585 [Gemmatimonadaceae bacterium]